MHINDEITAKELYLWVAWDTIKKKHTNTEHGYIS